MSPKLQTFSRMVPIAGGLGIAVVCVSLFLGKSEVTRQLEAARLLTHQIPTNVFEVFDESSYIGALWSLNRKCKISGQDIQYSSFIQYQDMKNLKKFQFFKQGNFILQLIVFKFLKLKSQNLTKSKPLEFLQNLNLFASYKQKIKEEFLFLTVL